MKSRNLQSGLSLIELMVALTIGAVLIFGATQVYVDSRKAYGTNEAVSRLQENARYAISVLEPDVRMAGFWGFLKGMAPLDANTWAAEASALGTVAAGSAANVCSRNFSVDVTAPVVGFQNQFEFSGNGTRDTTNCASRTTAGAVAAVASADTLIVRHGAVTQSIPTANVVQLCTSRLNGYLFSNGAACGDAPTTAAALTASDPSSRTHAVNNMVVDAYYVAQQSDNSTTTPSLRRKKLVAASLCTPTTLPCYVDEEVISGVEDMQVQFGIESDSATSPDGVATRYVNPDGVPAGVQIVAVRIWLMIRADEPETGFIDSRTYEYGDRASANGTTSNLSTAGSGTKAYVPSAASGAFPLAKNYRRLLVSRTIQLRNAVGT